MYVSHKVRFVFQTYSHPTLEKEERDMISLFVPTIMASFFLKGNQEI
jgi:hypothetical protein